MKTGGRGAPRGPAVQPRGPVQRFRLDHAGFYSAVSDGLTPPARRGGSPAQEDHLGFTSRQGQGTVPQLSPDCTLRFGPASSPHPRGTREPVPCGRQPWILGLLELQSPRCHRLGFALT